MALFKSFKDVRCKGFEGVDPERDRLASRKSADDGLPLGPGDTGAEAF